MSNWPLLQFAQNLEGFDFVALLLGAVVVFFSIGFAIDYIVGRYGMGPYWSGFYARSAPTRASASAIGGCSPMPPTIPT